ncbi:agarase [Catenovulum agarivorans DS-2]|uniref:Agarase n=1 Tax=Catenovulum agarivorans DS-2 TaxID=1328313 RepID=W7QWF5_9ALTE|nr:agarase [Catenovulum agarivorans]EWH09595.1 agarase [Catenovulum agarivorans DS-2]
MYTTRTQHTKLASLIILALSLSACGGSSESDDGNDSPTTPVEQTDTTPNTFNFSAQNNVALSTQITSASITITGINTKTPISISGGEYAIDNGAFTSAQGEIENNQSIKVRLTSAEHYNKTTSATVTIGGVTSKFDVTTEQFGGVQVDINLDTKHSLNGFDSFDRQKYITIHATQTEPDWGENDGHSANAANKDPDLMLNFVNNYDVYYGRETGGNKWHLRNVQEDTSKPGFVDEASMAKRGSDTKWGYSNFSKKINQDARAAEDRGLDLIIGAQQHPYWPEGTLVNAIGSNDWAFSTTDTSAEPLGTATGHYLAHYLAKFFKQENDTQGQPKPKYFEIMNEPLYDLTTVRSGSDRVDPATIFEFHNTVAAEIKKLPENSDILVGGYTVAFPDFDKDNFQRWFDRDKQFIDIAGANMDFYSIHLYDFPCFRNSERYRKGANAEATMDMMEHYSRIATGTMKPYVISEYGAAIHCLNKAGWSPERNTYQLRAVNSLLMQFLERPDVIAKTIPFIVVKAEWGRTDYPYGPRLMIQEFEKTGDPTQTDWVYSDLVKFYQLWSNVNGTRVDSKSSDLDIQVDAYVEGKKAYVILNNLEFDDANIKLNTLGLNGNQVASVKIKHLETLAGAEMQSNLTTLDSQTLPESVTLGKEATMIIEIAYTQDVQISEEVEEKKYYATEYLKTIEADTQIEYTINDVAIDTNGEAVLRIAVGRDHGLSLTPSVKVNGTQVEIPNDFRGYNQQQGSTMTGRDNFFGVLEIPVDYALLQASNKISLTFADDGGRVASASLQVFNSSKQLTRSF